MSTEHEKQFAAEAAAELVEDGMTVGLGTGSTVAYLLPALARRGLSLRCVATSPRTQEAALMLDLHVEPFGSIDRFDITIDGADQIAPDGWLVKGGGAAHTMEKIVAAAADRFVVIADSSKPVTALHPPVPLELLEFGLAATMRRLQPSLPARRAAQSRRRRHRGLPRCRRRPRGPGGAARRHPRRRRARPVPAGAGRRRVHRPWQLSSSTAIMPSPESEITAAPEAVRLPGSYLRRSPGRAGVAHLPPRGHSETNPKLLRVLRVSKWFSCSSGCRSRAAALVALAPRIIAAWVVVRPRVSDWVRTPVTELATVIDRPSRIQAVRSPRTMRV